ncbi:MAG: cytochrome c biogenesis protein CcdA, partial [Candidatus Heimdallarchaeota archaeon]
SFEGLNKLSDISNRIINRYDNNFLISYFIGLSFTMLAAPCAIIYFGTVFTLVPNSSMMISILLLTLYSFGAGLPFFMVSGIFPIIQDLLISKSNNIRNYVSIFSGILIIITGLIQFFDGLNLIELNYL